MTENVSQIFDGLLFGLGVLAVYLGAVVTGALVRSLAGAGDQGPDGARPSCHRLARLCARRRSQHHQRHAQHGGRQSPEVRHHRRRPAHLVGVAERLSRASHPPRRAAHDGRQSGHRSFRRRPPANGIGRRITETLASVQRHRKRPQPPRSDDPRGRLSRDLRAADQPDQRALHQRRLARSRARPADGRISLRDRADVRAAAIRAARVICARW